MDLGTVYVKLRLGMYPTGKKFKKDVDRVFGNCELYNKSLQQLHLVAYARHLKSFFKNIYMELVSRGEMALVVADHHLGGELMMMMVSFAGGGSLS